MKFIALTWILQGKLMVNKEIWKRKKRKPLRSMK